jgi:hypothetical protein
MNVWVMRTRRADGGKRERAREIPRSVHEAMRQRQTRETLRGNLLAAEWRVKFSASRAEERAIRPSIQAAFVTAGEMSQCHSFVVVLARENLLDKHKHKFLRLQCFNPPLDSEANGAHSVPERDVCTQHMITREKSKKNREKENRNR